MTKYHDKDKCYQCNGSNNIEIVATDEGYISECDAVCSNCGFESYWAYGFFCIEPPLTEKEKRLNENIFI